MAATTIVTVKNSRLAGEWRIGIFGITRKEAPQVSSPKRAAMDPRTIAPDMKQISMK